MEKETRSVLLALTLGGVFLAGCEANNAQATETVPQETLMNQVDYEDTLETLNETIEVLSVTGETVTVEPTATATPEPTFTPTATPIEIPTKEVISQAEIEFLASHELNIGDTSRRVMMMTYDDGGSVESVETVMGAAERYGGKVTFFMPGNWVAENPDLVREIVARGHLLECHGWDHTEMTALSDEQIRQQIGDFLRVMEEIVPEYEANFIRFPYGSRNDRVRRIAAEFGLQSVTWGYGSGGMDESTYSNAVNNAYPGAIMLSHSTRYYDVAAVEAIFASLSAQGYTLETVETGRAPEDVWSGK